MDCQATRKSHKTKVVTLRNRLESNHFVHFSGEPPQRHKRPVRWTGTQFRTWSWRAARGLWPEVDPARVHPPSTPRSKYQCYFGRPSQLDNDSVGSNSTRCWVAETDRL